MGLINAIFQQEWLLFKRQRWMPCSLLLFAVIGLLSIFTGRQEVRSRMIQADSMRISYQRDVDTVLKKFTDTSTAKGKADAKNAGLAVMINFRLPQTTIKEPTPLATLCIGLMDVMPWFNQVKFVKNYGEETIVPVSNPLVLFAGNFDYAFTLIYLLPLLIISWCYAVFDAEKNAGTLKLLAIQSGKPARVLRLKLLFRFFVITLSILLLNITGFLLSGAGHPPTLEACFAWSVLSLLYAGFWFALCRIMIAFRTASTISALSLVAVWLLLLLVAPSLVNAYTQAKQPLPLKDEIAAYRRHQGEIIWNTSPAVLSDSFNLYKPAYRSTIDPAKDTVKLSNRYIAGYYELLDQRMKRIIQPYNAALAARNKVTQQLLSWDPALLAQSAFAALAGNDASAYTEYEKQVDKFQQQWQDFLYPYHFSEKQLAPGTIAHNLPRFTYQQPGSLLTVTFPATLVMAVIILLLLSAAGYLENKHEYN